MPDPLAHGACAQRTMKLQPMSAFPAYTSSLTPLSMSSGRSAALLRMPSPLDMNASKTLSLQDSKVNLGFTPKDLRVLGSFIQVWIHSSSR